MSSDLARSETFSIGRTAALTGLSAELLRVWERRYGVPKPRRRASGHRRYTAGQVDWLKHVARAVEQGHRPSAVLRLPEAELRALVAEPAPAPAVPAHIEMLLRGLELGEVEAFALELAADSRRRGPYAFASETVMPLVLALAARREEGRMDADGEQRARALLTDVLRTYQQRLYVHAGGPRVLGTSLDGIRRGFPMQLGVMITMAMGAYAEIGPDAMTGRVPEAVRVGGFDVIGARIEEAHDAYERARRLRASIPDPSVRVVVGGAGTLDVPAWPAGVEVANGVDEWLRWLQAYMARPEARSDR